MKGLKDISHFSIKLQVIVLRILMLGCKEWPYGSSAGQEDFVGGGTGRYITSLSNGLIKNNIKVDLITRLFKGQQKIECTGDLTIHRVWFINNFYARLPTFAVFSFLTGLQISNKVDVVHGHGLFGCLTAIAISKIINKPCIATPHGLSSRENRKLGRKIVKLLGRLENFVYKRADVVVFVSGNERDGFLEKIDMNQDKCRIIESGTEIPEIDSRPVKTNKNEVTLLYVGRLVNGKGLEELIRAIPILNPEIKRNLKLNIVGDGYLKVNLEAIVKELHLENCVTFSGFQPDPKQFYLSSDIYILPSSHEGFPVALLEAMSYGLPCIINDFGVPMSRDSILLMPNNSTHTIAEYIQRLASNKDYMEILGVKGRQLVINRFSFDRVINEYIGLYNDLKEESQ